MTLTFILLTVKVNYNNNVFTSELAHIRTRVLRPCLQENSETWWVDPIDARSISTFLWILRPQFQLNVQVSERLLPYIFWREQGEDQILAERGGRRSMGFWLAWLAEGDLQKVQDMYTAL